MGIIPQKLGFCASFAYNAATRYLQYDYLHH